MNIKKPVDQPEGSTGHAAGHLGGYTVNDYRTIIGRFIRKSFVIFIYR